MPAGNTPGPQWPMTGRARAKDLAFRQADDTDIVTVLRTEFPPASRSKGAAEKRWAECQQLVDDLSDALRAERLRGELHIMDRLFTIADSDSREAITAATWLAREVLGHGQSIDIRFKRLMKRYRQNPEEVEIAMESIRAKMEARRKGSNVLTLGGGK